MVGFHRFVLTQTRELKAEFTQPLQVIIGTNGSGKSSILELLTADAAISSYFQKDVAGAGLKKTIIHHGHEYTLAARFDGQQRHYLAKDGVVLNDWGTQPIQKELVKQEFGLTPVLVSLLQGKEKFTRMSPIMRKEWFIRLCDANYEYAMRVYNRFRELLRDAEGALKNAKKKLAAEQAGVLKPDEEKALIKEVSDFHALVEGLLEIRIPVERDPTDVMDDIYQLTRQINEASDKLTSYHKATSKTGKWSEAQADAVLTRLRTDMSVSSALLQTSAQEHQDNAAKIDILQKAEAKTLDALRAEQDELVVQIQSLVGSLLVPTLSQPLAALSQWETVKDSLVDVLSNICANADRRYSSATQARAEEQQLKLQQKIKQLSEESVKLRVQLEHLVQHKDQPNITCPQCDHRFSSQYDAAQHAALQQQLTLIEQAYQAAQTQLGDVQTFLAECADFAQYYRQYSRMVSSSGALESYWRDVFYNDAVYTSPAQLVYRIYEVSDDIASQIKVAELKAQLEAKMELIAKLSRLDTADLTVLQQRQEVLQESINKHTNRLSRLSNRIKHYQGIKQQAKSIAQLLEAAQSASAQLQTRKTEHLEASRRVTFNAFLREMQSLLARKVSALQDNQKTQTVIQALERSIVDLNEEILAYSALVDSLCPNKGLIAQGLYGFLENFISDMNATIAAVWTYELRLGLPSVEDGVELNYRFPMTINGEKGPKDAGLCSEGQCDIIDFAFTFTARKYLGLQDYPLIIDELGRTFDAAHKDNLAMFLKRLIEETSVQIFMVSHDFRAYSSMPAEYLVLSKDNVLLPAIFNRHVVID